MKEKVIEFRNLLKYSAEVIETIFNYLARKYFLIQEPMSSKSKVNFSFLKKWNGTIRWHRVIKNAHKLPFILPETNYLRSINES